MKARFSPSVFAVAFCATYALVFGRDWPLFRYYPLNGDFNWGNGLIKDAGPAMSWYGFVADSTIVALVLALLIPEDLAARVLRGRMWLFPCAAMLWSLYLLRQLFLRHLLG